MTHAPAQAEPPASSLARKLAIAAADIKLAHSVFALPFAVLGAFLVAPRVAESNAVDWAGLAGRLALVIACMVAARTWAMLVNRVADRRLDAHNPRTKSRAFAAGRLTPRDGLIMLAASAATFVLLCGGFWLFYANPWPLILGPVVLTWLGFYSFTKRFTALCHVVLGTALAASPLAAAVALGGVETVTAWADPTAQSLWAIAGFVALWVAGFDVIYALADLEYDRSKGLRSIPAALGWRGASFASLGMHTLASVGLVASWLVEPRLGWLYGAGVLATIGLLAAEHVVLATRRERGLSVAFFTLNGIASLLLGFLGVASVLAGGGL